MLNIKKSLQRGDTLIEVLFSVSVFSLVAVGSLSLMNQGANTSQRALEITLVRQGIDSQTEALRFLHDSYVVAYQKGLTSYSVDTPAGQWYQMLTDIKDAKKESASSFGNTSACLPVLPSGSFIINTQLAKYIAPGSIKYKQASTYSKVSYDDKSLLTATEGIWIEAINSETNVTLAQGEVGFIDFHIRACWDSVGLSVPMTIGTIVRLYEP